MDFSLLDGSLSLFNVFRLAKYRREFARLHPDYFGPDGILVFCGPQGSGKTLSMVQYARKVCARYPKCVVCSNIDILGISNNVIPWQGVESLVDVQNGEHGVLYLIDEMHLEFNSLESKKIDANVFEQISQQRKQRKHIVGTSQVYTRLAKPFREQFRYAVFCRSTFGHSLQVNSVVDAETAKEVDGQLITETVKRCVWFHTPALYEAYDTYAVVKRMRDSWSSKEV